MRAEMALRIARNARKHPVDFVRHVLGLDPTDYQASILESIRDHRLTSVGSCHSAGKSGCAGQMVVPWFLCAHPGSIVITTAPTFRQVRGILWDRIRAARNRARIKLGGKLNVTRWEFAEGWFAEGITAPPHDPTKFQGFHSETARLLCVVDEAAGVDQRLYDEGIMPIVTAAADRLLLIGNTTSTGGEFRRSSKKNSGYNYLKVSAFDTPNFTETGITLEDIEEETWEPKVAAWQAQNPGRELPRPYLVSPAWVAGRAKAWGTDSVLFGTRILAKFLDEGVEVVVPPAWVERAQERWKSLRREDFETLRKTRGFDGLDVARMGEDSSVRGSLRPFRSGFVYSKRWELAKNDTTILASKVRSDAAKDSLPIALMVDLTGVGAGVYDVLKDDPPKINGDLGLVVRAPILPFTAGGKAIDSDRFPNQRSEAAWYLRKLFESDRIAINPEDHVLAEELSTVRWGPSPKGKHSFILETKDDYKERNGKSPDHFDACSIAAYCEHGGPGTFSYA